MMRLKSVRSCTLKELNHRAEAFIAACGYERRSTAIAGSIVGIERRLALCYDEWPNAIARPSNEKIFAKMGFSMVTVSANDSMNVENAINSIMGVDGSSVNSFAVDISSMTRAWHGGIVRQIRTMERDDEFETFFAYAPTVFRPPVAKITPNEAIVPVDGFASLVAPDLPVAAIIGMGYERERALGLQQYLDPELTLLMIPKSGDNDRYYAALKENNRALLDRTDPKWVFEYDLTDPSVVFSTLASVVAGLRESYRIVLASLGPKIFGLLCFLLACKFSDVSVWRVSTGAHGKPRDAEGDLSRLAIASAMWIPAALGADDLK